MAFCDRIERVTSFLGWIVGDVRDGRGFEKEATRPIAVVGGAGLQATAAGLRETALIKARNRPRCAAPPQSCVRRSGG